MNDLNSQAKSRASCCPGHQQSRHVSPKYAQSARYSCQDRGRQPQVHGPQAICESMRYAAIENPVSCPYFPEEDFVAALYPSLLLLQLTKSTNQKSSTSLQLRVMWLSTYWEVWLRQQFFWPLKQRWRMQGYHLWTLVSCNCVTIAWHNSLAKHTTLAADPNRCERAFVGNTLGMVSLPCWSTLLWLESVLEAALSWYQCGQKQYTTLFVCLSKTTGPF